MMWWSYALSALGLLSLWAAGREKSWAWQLGYWVQVPWAVYALQTRQFGFLVSAAAYFWVCWTNARRGVVRSEQVVTDERIISKV